MFHSIGLIDYGMGNLHSVQQAFKRLNNPVKLIRSPSDLTNLDALILPGVGAFDPAMKNLNSTGLIPDLKSWVNDGKPLLGICLGLQLLFESSNEGQSEGLGLLKGHVEKLPAVDTERIPHMGWSLLKKHNQCPLFNNEPEPLWMYFVHSYSAIPKNKNELAATANYGIHQLTAIVWKDNFGACQFHPEKSSHSGQKILGNWLNWLKHQQ